MNEGINVSEMSGGGAMMVLLGTESHAISSLRLNLEHNLSSIFLVEKSLIHHVGSPFSLLLLWYQPQNWERERCCHKIWFWIEKLDWEGGNKRKCSQFSALLSEMFDKFYWWIQHDHFEYLWIHVLQKVFITNIVLWH